MNKLRIILIIIFIIKLNSLCPDCLEDKKGEQYRLDTSFGRIDEKFTESEIIEKIETLEQNFIDYKKQYTDLYVQINHLNDWKKNKIEEKEKLQKEINKLNTKLNYLNDNYILKIQDLENKFKYFDEKVNSWHSYYPTQIR